MDALKLQHWVNPQRILVATNLQDESALTYEAASQARKCGGRIILVHVLQPSSLHTGIDRGPDSLGLDSRRGAAWKALLHMARMIEWQGADCEPVLLEGDPVDQIPGLVSRRGVDRVIGATRSARGLERLLAGSVAEGLMNALELPVCVIGPNASASPSRGTLGGRVLLALSLHHDRPDCVQFAALLAVRRRSTLTFLHALDVVGMGSAYRRVARGMAHASMAALASGIPGSLPEFSIEIREGSPAHEILDEDACAGYDFIVMGSSSPGVVSQLIGSSVVHRVIAEARCPVITLRRSPDANRKKVGAGASIRPPGEKESAAYGMAR